MNLTQIILGIVIFIVCGWIASLGMNGGGLATFFFLGIAAVICVLSLWWLGIPQYIVYGSNE